MDREDKIRETVRQKFSDYLSEKKCRKTPERFAILNIIYSEQRHFDVDSLFEALARRSFRVSRATLYNTIQLLLECNLIQKHQFGKNISVYERSFNNDYHHHLICTSCGKIREYRNMELKTAISGKKIKNFKVTHYSLYVYGLCGSCLRGMKKANHKGKSNP
ncbi:MAG: transcriptional repressor [Dysgonamonadaceae bacterium]|jgi:Fur family ferric uptake transcriptional regulator|nr:transcriptional repressor [Dysgonamonadaceae bacterium]